MSEARKMVLNMLAEGKITLEESEKLLSALGSTDGSEKKDYCQQTNSYETAPDNVANIEPEKKQESERESQSTVRPDEFKEKKESRNSFDDDFFNSFGNAGKLGFDLKNLAQNIQQTIQQTVKKAAPHRKEIKEKIKEFGVWMQDLAGNMANEIMSGKDDLADGVAVDFIASLPDYINNCEEFDIENIFGEIRINEGSDFKFRITGRVSSETMGEYQPAQWFTRNGTRVVDNTLFVGFNSNQSLKAFIDMEVTIPFGKKVNCRSIAGMIRIRGNYKIGNIKTISGKVSIQGSELRQSLIETVSGSIQVEGGDIAMRLTSTSGDFIVRDARIEKLEVNLVSGDIMIGEASISEETDANLVTTSGDIFIEKMNGPWEIVEAITRSGNVTIDWKSDLTPINSQGTVLKSGGKGARFKAESVNGDIKFS